MKRPLLCSFLILIFSILGCNNDDSVNPTEIVLTVNHRFLLADNISTITLEAMGANNEPLLSNEVEFFVNDSPLTSNSFRTGEAGQHTLEARLGESISNKVTVMARAPKQLPKIEVPIIFHIVEDIGVPIGIGNNFTMHEVHHLFNQLNGRFNNTAVNANITNPNKTIPNIFFRLAENDPNGNSLAELGINRATYPNTSATLFFEDWMEDIFWDTDRYINIWVGRASSNFSFATHPNFQSGVTSLQGMLAHPKGFDGIILSPDVINNNWVSTFAHELGHFFGLLHVFDDSCNQADSDFCPDTKFWLNPGNSLFPSTTTRESCSGETYISNNFMDYANGLLNTFTFDQVGRMRYALNFANGRAQRSQRVID